MPSVTILKSASQYGTEANLHHHHQTKRDQVKMHILNKYVKSSKLSSTLEKISRNMNAITEPLIYMDSTKARKGVSSNLNIFNTNLDKQSLRSKILTMKPVRMMTNNSKLTRRDTLYNIYSLPLFQKTNQWSKTPVKLNQIRYRKKCACRSISERRSKLQPKRSLLDDLAVRITSTNSTLGESPKSLNTSQVSKDATSAEFQSSLSAVSPKPGGILPNHPHLTSPLGNTVKGCHHGHDHHGRYHEDEHDEHCDEHHWDEHEEHGYEYEHHGGHHHHDDHDEHDEHCGDHDGGCGCDDHHDDCHHCDHEDDDHCCDYCHEYEHCCCDHWGNHCCHDDHHNDHHDHCEHDEHVGCGCGGGGPSAAGAAGAGKKIAAATSVGAEGDMKTSTKALADAIRTGSAGLNAETDSVAASSGGDRTHQSVKPGAQQGMHQQQQKPAASKANHAEVVLLPETNVADVTDDTKQTANSFSESEKSEQKELGSEIITIEEMGKSSTAHSSTSGPNNGRSSHTNKHQLNAPSLASVSGASTVHLPAHSIHNPGPEKVDINVQPQLSKNFRGRNSLPLQ